ncbi:hypothetical protein NONI108955_23820 [Nocardia ninae]|uniref:Uncharacterized protein n=1 Tax=Nocardia ninae NBRC 108245 TaxID=1210091 RepID=A0A511MQ67_9NOCA|nr:hypothetical protein [Nocardia ninae]GEM42317.1 hypothetical protein NN4_68360 [Nocardia ninae NBRC 108245]
MEEKFGVDADQFAALVLQQLTEAGEHDAKYDPDEFTITVGDLELYLGNVFREAAHLPADDRDARIARYIAGVKDADGPDTWLECRALLRPILRPNGFGLNTPTKETLPISRPAFPFLDELVAIDKPNSRSIVSGATLERWGIAADEVFAAARENLTALVGSHGIEEAGLLHFADNGDGYCTSWPLIPGWLAGSGDGTHRPIAFMPDVDTLLIVPDDGDLTPLFEHVEQQYRAAVRPISPQGYTVDDNGTVIPLDQVPDHRHHALALRARCGLAITEYDTQTEALKTAMERDFVYPHHDDLDPAFVASVLYVAAEEGPHTVTVWGQGVEYLLPEADRILFCTEENGEMQTLFEVPFAAAAEITGLTPIPGMSPRRYEIRHWPNPETLTRLEAAAVPH